MAYFRAVAREVREILAEMGFRSLDEDHRKAGPFGGC